MPPVPGPAARELLRLAGDPLRWALLGELARSDRQVHELTSLLGRPQNLVSYHLGKLRTAGLVTARRSSADGRDTYYAVDLPRFGELLAEAGRAVHPGLLLVPAVPGARRRPPGGPARRLLFLCTGNSARSQMAEALAVARSDGLVEAYSAGSRPKPLHANAVRVMAERGIDLTARRSKHVSLFAGQPFDHVITLCDRVREVCPEFPGHPDRIHWSIPDPSASGGDDAAALAAFRRTAAEVETRIGYLLAGLAAAPGQAIG
jgi:ArsR family transcriptional regulator, arsenate/arsenite/antimonite-responsive transcriptional repressor / arsenate reductase (thioredoxin)